MKNTTKKSWFKARRVTVFFAIVALVGGIFFLDWGITGNVVLTNKYSFDFLSLVGLLLILCSIVLGAYTATKK